MTQVAAIHQPNFFPWLGYFNKLARAHVFVVLDDAQYQKTGGSWSNRVRLLVAGQARWVTAPVRRPAHGSALVRELCWDEQPWRARMVRSLALNYAGCAFRDEAMALLEPLVTNPEPNLAAYNLHAVRAIATALELSPRLEIASHHGVGLTGTDRLVQLVHKVGCDTYLVGGGAQGYQQDAAFTAQGIAVRAQDFRHPTYPQRGSTDFIAGLSIIDALMNCGIAATRELVRA